jgi:hypothetical protein
MAASLNGNGTAVNGPVNSPIASSAPTVAPIPEPSEDEIALFHVLVKRGESKPSKIKLSPEEELAILTYVIRDIEDADAANRLFKKNLADLSMNWRGNVDPKTFPFEGAANVRVPLTSVFVETMKARLKKAMIGGDLVTRMSYLDRQVDQQDLDEANKWFHWELKNVVKLDRWVEDMLHNVLNYGLDISIPSYEHETRYLHSVKRWQFNGDNPLGALIEAALAEITNEKTEWGADVICEVVSQSKPGIFKLSCTDKQDGKKFESGQVVFSLKIESQELQADVWKRETIFDGARINDIKLEDLVVANTEASLEAIPFFGVRMFVSIPDYRQGIEDGFFIDWGEEENRRIATTTDIRVGDVIGTQVTNIQDATIGTDSKDSYSYSPVRKWLEVYRYEGWWVWDDSGDTYNYDKILQPATQICVWVVPRARRIIKIERLEDLNKDAKRSGVKFEFIREPGRFYPMGLAEWVRHSQAELDAIHNQRLDAGLLFNVPFGFYKPTAIGKGEVIKIEPGKLFPVADPQGVNMPRSNWQPSFSFAEEGLVKRYAGEQAGLTEASIGQPVTKRQSASEFVGTASALDLRTEDIVDGLLRSLSELLYRILGLYQQFGPRERIFRVGGEEGVQLTKRFERDRLQGKILLEMSGNLQQINEQLQKQVAVDMMQILLNEIFIQSGIVGPDTMYAAIKQIAKYMHYNDVPLHKPDLPPQSDAPDVEEKQMFAGQKPIGPSISENINEHLHHHSMTMADSRLMESWTDESRQLLQQHVQATLQAQQAKQLLIQQQMAMAAQAQTTFAEKGIRPGKSGDSQPTKNLGPGSQAEGVRGAGAGGPAGGGVSPGAQ